MLRVGLGTAKGYKRGNCGNFIYKPKNIQTTMSSGTLVKIQRYYNRYHLRSLEELHDHREQAIKESEKVWASILALCMATPKDITPNGEDPASYITEILMGYREMLTEVEYHIQAYNDIEEGWDTKEED